MADFWATLSLDSGVVSPRHGARRRLAAALRDAVRDGSLAPGTRLPSSRRLAEQLGVARNTVADSYTDLIAEGWLVARQGSGTTVAEVVAARATAPGPRPPESDALSLRSPVLLGGPDLAAFPRMAWVKAVRRAVASAPPHVFGHGDPLGLPELRTVLADHLTRTRGVQVHRERLMICGGVTDALAILGSVLSRRGTINVAVEPLGLSSHWKALTAAGARTSPLSMETGGVVVPAETANAVLLTPPHLFPIGTTPPRDHRAAVVDWARRTGGFILENDCDGEFQYDRHSIGALQSLDPDHVVYMGSVDKSLAPGLCLGWMVLPFALVDESAEVKKERDTCGIIDQLTLAEFLASGAYERHVRAARRRYRSRREALLAAVTQRASGVHVTGAAAGLHAVLSLPDGTEQQVLKATTARGIEVAPLAQFRHDDATMTTADFVVFGYGSPSDDAWPRTLASLARALP
ncbi:PLP-dependent aminotransferase family protein [Streptomyces sp. NE06-03E]|uniref:MocR-like pyridoxine biosynthesis transcription factor PdxR n=1 Tax=unclassified Streptomyces TaxID=2593676 RepID=UPI0029ABC7D6|nr:MULTISPECIES: PLP-dependent aminotransferase family protein [unclassified Streptomyces]MDX3054295.1 PLP-dependent aminotransferase family protein [Streptomyces sp. NE06-03E]